MQKASFFSKKILFFCQGFRDSPCISCTKGNRWGFQSFTPAGTPYNTAREKQKQQKENREEILSIRPTIPLRTPLPRRNNNTASGTEFPAKERQAFPRREKQPCLAYQIRRTAQQTRVPGRKFLPGTLVCFSEYPGTARPILFMFYLLVFSHFKRRYTKIQSTITSTVLRMVKKIAHPSSARNVCIVFLPFQFLLRIRSDTIYNSISSRQRQIKSYAPQLLQRSFSYLFRHSKIFLLSFASFYTERYHFLLLRRLSRG